MLTLKEWMELVDHRITEGGDYYSNIGTLYSLTSWSGDQDGYSFEIIFDTNDQQRVYMVQACDFAKNRAYRLVDTALDESKQAWEGVEWVDLESDDDFIQKALAIRTGEDYDTRVSVPLELDDDIMFELMKMAHERDMTLNDFVAEILTETLDGNGL